MKIRKAQENDIEKLVNIEMSSGYHKDKFDFKPCLQKLFEQDVSLLVAEEESDCSGYITLAHDGEIGFLSVSKKYQNKGIATSLLNEIMLYAKKKEVEKLFLDVRNDNIPAIILYLKNGFVITSQHTVNIEGNTVIKLRLEKFLSTKCITD